MDNGLKQRWLHAHSSNEYLPPYLGGPIDELYLDQISRGRRVEFGPHVPEPPSLHYEPDLRLFRLRQRPRGRFNPPLIRPMENMLIPREPFCSFWIRIYDFQQSHYNSILNFFSDVGALSDRRINQPDAIYLRYLSPLHGHMALSYSQRPLSIAGSLIRVRTERISKAFIDLMDRSRVIDEDTTCDNQPSNISDWGELLTACYMTTDELSQGCCGDYLPASKPPLPMSFCLWLWQWLLNWLCQWVFGTHI